MPIRQQRNSCWSYSCYCTQQKCFTAFWGVTKLIISETEVIFVLEAAWIWFDPDPRWLVSCAIRSIKVHMALWRHAINSAASWRVLVYWVIARPSLKLPSVHSLSISLMIIVWRTTPLGAAKMKATWWLLAWPLINKLFNSTFNVTGIKISRWLTAACCYNLNHYLMRACSPVDPHLYTVFRNTSGPWLVFVSKLLLFKKCTEAFGITRVVVLQFCGSQSQEIVIKDSYRCVTIGLVYARLWYKLYSYVYFHS